jgi:KDO2-lipid IV(A) lauroyltransferase
LLAILGYLIVALGVRLLPARLADRLGVWVARAVFALHPGARRAAEENLRRLRPELTGEERRGLARGAFEHFALALVGFVRRDRESRATPGAIEVHGRRHLDAALATGRGVILLSAHLGDWERGAAYVAALGARLHVVARPHPNRWVDQLFLRRRRARGVNTLCSRLVWAGAAEALRRGEWVAVLGDRAPAGASHSVCAWAAALARRTGALVLPGALVRVAPGRYRACFEAPLAPVEGLAGGYRDAMRRLIGRYPAQWCAFEPLPREWA